MLRFIKSLFSPGPAIPEKQERDPERYETEKKTAGSKDVKKRLTLARNSKTHQEILYYLAEKDPDPSVRQAVAANPSTPLQAGKSLAMDDNPDVRLALAKRLIELVPHLSKEKHSQIYAYMVQALGTLALDEVLKIRVALSSSLKDIAQTPPKVANTLARDIERQVAEPVLLYCAALSDDDLIDIIRGHDQSWAIQAVAAREHVSDDVSKAVIDTGDTGAGTILMENEGAIITEMLLEEIIEKAKDIPEWQAPIANRPSLPPEVARELAQFANESVKDILTKRKDLDPAVCEEIAHVFERRLDLANENAATSDLPVPDRLQKLVEQDRLNEQTFLDYLGMRDRGMAVAILARMAGTNEKEVERILAMKAAKPVIALAWKAGLSMRAALKIEKDLAFVDPKKLIYPRDGTEYPFQEEELQWQLEFLGLEAA